MRNWEHPPWYGIDQSKERVILTFLENQKGLFHNLTTHFRMPVKQEMISGPCQETSFTAITLNPESSFTRREKNHSHSTEIHWRLQNYSYKLGCYARKPHRWLLEYRWIKRFVWFLDRFHSVYSVNWETSTWMYVFQGETDKTASDIQAGSFMARTLERNGKKC